MPRPKTKEELMLASKENYEKLNRFISQLSEDELQTPFDFSRDPKKKEAHWKRDKNLRDVLIHLYEWQLGYILIKKVTKDLFSLNLIIGKLMEK